MPVGDEPPGPPDAGWDERRIDSRPAGTEDGLETELRRLVERWRALPIDQAKARLPMLRRHVQCLADQGARLAGRAATAVPDLGPAVALDQLLVMVHDVARLGGSCEQAAAARRLRGIRRGL